MIKLKGTTLYPPAIFDVINRVTEVGDYLVEVFKNEMDQDALRLHITVEDELNGRVKEKIMNAFHAYVRVTPEIIFSPAEQIQKMQIAGTGRKVNRLMDKRNH